MPPSRLADMEARKQWREVQRLARKHIADILRCQASFEKLASNNLRALASHLEAEYREVVYQTRNKVLMPISI